MKATLPGVAPACEDDPVTFELESVMIALLDEKPSDVDVLAAVAELESCEEELVGSEVELVASEEELAGREEELAGREEEPAGREEEPAGREEEPAGREEEPAGREELPPIPEDAAIPEEATPAELPGFHH